MTIYDIAQEAGVSITTVSRVINGKGKVSAQTRERVQQILTAYDYVPNQVAQGLASKVTKIVGILAMDIRDEHHASIAYRIEQAMSQADYSAIVCNLGGRRERLQKYLETLAARQISGLFLVGSTFANETCRAMLQATVPQMPVILANGILEGSNIYGVLADEETGTADAVRYLIGQGRRHIALMTSSDTPSDRNKRAGYERVMQEHGLPALCIEEERSLAGGQRGTARLLQLCPQLDAIQYTEDITAAGGVHALHHAGVDIPGQVAVIGCNASNIGLFCYPTITSIDNRLGETGERAAHMMIRLLNGETDVPHTEHLTCGLILRDSTEGGGNEKA